MADWYVAQQTGDDGGGGGDGSLANPWLTIQHAVDNATAGDQINVRDETATALSATINFGTGFSGSTSVDSPLIFRGYTSSKNDGGIGNIKGSGTLIINDNTMDGIQFIDIELSDYGTDFAFDLDNEISLINTIVNGGGIGAGVSLDDNFQFIHSKFTGIDLTAGPVLSGAFNGVGFCNYFEMSGNANVTAITGGTSWLGNTLVTTDTNSGHEIFLPRDGSLLLCNTFYGPAATNCAILLNAATEGVAIISNYFEGWGDLSAAGIIIDSGSPGGSASIVAGNRFYLCAAKIINNGRIHYEVDNEFTTASGLTNPGSSDFTPTSELIDAGWPADFFELSGNAQAWDVGAIQSAAAGGSSVLNILNRRTNSLSLR